MSGNFELQLSRFPIGMTLHFIGRLLVLTLILFADVRQCCKWVTDVRTIDSRVSSFTCCPENVSGKKCQRFFTSCMRRTYNLSSLIRNNEHTHTNLHTHVQAHTHKAVINQFPISSIPQS